MGHVILTLRPFRDGLSSMGLDRLLNKFEVSVSIRYEDMKRDAKCRNRVGLGYLGVTQGHLKYEHSIERI